MVEISSRRNKKKCSEPQRMHFRRGKISFSKPRLKNIFSVFLPSPNEQGGGMEVVPLSHHYIQKPAAILEEATYISVFFI